MVSDVLSGSASAIWAQEQAPPQVSQAECFTAQRHARCPSKQDPVQCMRTSGIAGSCGPKWAPVLTQHAFQGVNITLVSVIVLAFHCRESKPSVDRTPHARSCGPDPVIQAVSFPPCTARCLTYGFSWKKSPSFIGSSRNQPERSTELSTQERKNGALRPFKTFALLDPTIGIPLRAIPSAGNCRRLSWKCGTRATTLSSNVFKEQQTGARGDKRRAVVTPQHRLGTSVSSWFVGQ